MPFYAIPGTYHVKGLSPDGDSIRFKATNPDHWKLLDGLAYPTFYEGLFYDLRNDLAKATVQVRRRKKGIWKFDKSAALILKGTESVTDDHPVFPKLFRRLMTHYGENGTFDGFNEYLERRRERTTIVSLCHFTHFDNQIKQPATQLKLVRPVEDMVFPG